MGHALNLCYQAYKYTFVVSLTSNAGFRIHLNVPVVDAMDYICPTTEDL